MAKIKTVADVVAAFGGPTAFGKACGFDKNACGRGTDMRRRQSIPSKHWQTLILAARRLRVRGITLEVLAAIHQGK